MEPPRGPGDVGAPWLQAILRESGSFPAARVRSVEVERIGEGFGLDGVVARVRTTGDGVPPTVVLKWPGRGQGAREATFLGRVALGRGWPVPRLLGAAPLVAGGDDWILAMDDVADGRTGDVLVGATADEAEQVITAEAEIHAAHWGRPDDPALADLPRWGAEVRDEAARTEAAVPAFLEVVAPTLPAAAADAARRVPAALADARTALARSPQTLIHADLHTENVLFRDGRAPVLIDWTDASIGPAARDVAHLLADGVAVEIRRAEGERLLGAYVAALARHGASYSVARIRDDVREVMRILFAAAIRWVAEPVDPAQPARVVAVRDLLARNTALAVVDDGI